MKKAALIELINTTDNPCVQNYLRKMLSIGYLSKQRKKELCELIMNKEGDAFIEARNELITYYLPLVIDCAILIRKSHPNVPLADLIQEGNLALIKGVESIKNKDYGNYYSYLSLRRHFQFYLFNRFKNLEYKLNRIKYSLNNISIYKKLSKEWEFFCNKNMWLISPMSIPSFMWLEKDIDEDELYRYYELCPSWPEIMNVELADMEDVVDEESFYYLQYNEEVVYLIFMVNAIMKRSLKDKERELIKMHYLSNYTLRELAAIYDLTPERIRQIISNGIKKVRRANIWELSDVLNSHTEFALNCNTDASLRNPTKKNDKAEGDNVINEQDNNIEASNMKDYLDKISKTIIDQVEKRQKVKWKHGDVNTNIKTEERKREKREYRFKESLEKESAERKKNVREKRQKKEEIKKFKGETRQKKLEEIERKMRVIRTTHYEQTHTANEETSDLEIKDDGIIDNENIFRYKKPALVKDNPTTMIYYDKNGNPFEVEIVEC